MKTITFSAEEEEYEAVAAMAAREGKSFEDFFVERLNAYVRKLAEDRASLESVESLAEPPPANLSQP